MVVLLQGVTLPAPSGYVSLFLGYLFICLYSGRRGRGLLSDARQLCRKLRHIKGRAYLLFRNRLERNCRIDVQKNEKRPPDGHHPSRPKIHPLPKFPFMSAIASRACQFLDFFRSRCKVVLFKYLVQDFVKRGTQRISSALCRLAGQ